MDVQRMTADELIAAGYRRVHWGRIENGLAPRGEMAKESLSASIAERLDSFIESWTDPRYGDSVSQSEALTSAIDQLDRAIDVVRSYIQGRYGA